MLLIAIFHCNRTYVPDAAVYEKVVFMASLSVLTLGQECSHNNVSGKRLSGERPLKQDRQTLHNIVMSDRLQVIRQLIDQRSPSGNINACNLFIGNIM